MIRRLKDHADFVLAGKKGKRADTPAFTLQRRDREDGKPVVRVGFTAAKKHIGTATERNRVKRRLREVVRVGGIELSPGHDYVLVAKKAALSRPFQDMIRDLQEAQGRLSGSTA